MKSGIKFAIVLLLAVGVAATYALREAKRAAQAPAASAAGALSLPATSPAATGGPSPATTPSDPPGAAAAGDPVSGTPPGRPRLVELGSVRCQACQQMMKVLDALRASQGERLRVDFVDVFEDPAAGERYGLTMIPTQIFFDAGGKEIFRHTGFLSHDDILAKFRTLGVEL